VLKCWTEFNLPSLQKSLDQTVSEQAQKQDESEKAKRKLIELTKEWRRTADEEVRNKASPVIKAFQKEVDSLNKRAKSVEDNYLFLYKNLLEIPDPVPVLKQFESVSKQLEKAKDFELENEKLRETLKEYHSEFAEVKNQEVTIKELREKLKEYEEKSEESLQAKLDERDKVLQETYKQRESQLQNGQLEVAAKLGEAEAKVKSLQEALKTAEQEVFDVKAKYDEQSAARLSEMEILENDLERANQNALAAEKDAEAVKEQLLAAISGSTSNSDMRSADYSHQHETILNLEAQLMTKDRELSQLVEEVHHLQHVSSKQKDAADKEIGFLERDLADKNLELTKLEQVVKSQSDYVEVKRELQMLKMIEFPTSDQEDTPLTGVKSLEKLLLSKNKSLQSECTVLKVKNAELQGKYDEAQKSISELNRSTKDQQDLITQLEKDLVSVHGYERGEGEGQAAPSADAELVNKVLMELAEEEDIPSEKQASDSLLPIIASQRERFRTKNVELEAQTRHQQRQISMLQSEVDTVRQDNVKLYEKIKFLQSYPSSKSQTSVDVQDDSVEKYSSQYEQKMDPFAVFARKERQRKYVNLTAPEKVTLNMARFILSNKLARSLVFFYTILLHMLVFVVLYKFAYTEQCHVDIASIVRQDSFDRRSLRVPKSLNNYDGYG